MRRCLIAVFVTGVVAGGTPAIAGSVPLEPSEDPNTQLAVLKRRAAGLEKEYRGSLEILSDARTAARRAADQAGRRNRELEAARARIGALAANSYMGGPSGSVPIVLATRGDSVRDAVLVEYMARSNAMNPIDRRSFLRAGLLAAGGVGLTACGGGERSAEFVTPNGAQVRATEVRRRVGPVRDFRLTAAEGPVDLGGRTVRTWTYDGRLPGPQIRVRAGEVVRVRRCREQVTRESPTRQPRGETVTVLIVG